MLSDVAVPDESSQKAADNTRLRIFRREIEEVILSKTDAIHENCEHLSSSVPVPLRELGPRRAGS